MKWYLWLKRQFAKRVPLKVPETPEEWAAMQREHNAQWREIVTARARDVEGK